MRIGTIRLLLLWSAALLLLAADSSQAAPPPDRVVPTNIHFLGWDPSTERFYYVIDNLRGRGGGRVDTLSTLKYYDAGDSTDQQPHRLVDAFRSQTDKTREFRKQISDLQKRLQPIQIIDSADSARVARVNPRAFRGDDYVTTIADLRVTFRDYAGAWTTYFSCGPSAPLRITGVVLAPNGRDGIAIMRNVTEDTQCRFTLLMLISKRPVALLRQEWNQGP